MAWQFWDLSNGKISYLKISFYCEIYPHIGKNTYMLGLHIAT
jgi:hypothetical protein